MTVPKTYEPILLLMSLKRNEYNNILSRQQEMHKIMATPCRYRGSGGAFVRGSIVPDKTSLLVPVIEHTGH